ncbi:MAG: acetyl-CoA carboxylase, carboxyltransferase subunit beta [Candidatus Muirbacterium halophilum]|nr:acetyl-CoA carboxylase, carboxyltransferase subunit beta [Candidatus Muirbacterium halophilum]
MNWFSEHLNIASLWVKCKNCGQGIFNKSLSMNLYVCPKCDFHEYIPVEERLKNILDKGKYKELYQNVISKDFLDFEIKGEKYNTKIEKTILASGKSSAFTAVSGKIGGVPVNVGVMDFKFFGGSMGSVVGEKFYRLAMSCIDKKRPLIVFSASGGARMQEAIISLMQMAKTSAALALLEEKNIPFISVLTHPTTGGVSASFAFLGDVIIAEKGALIGFAGPRVIEQTIKQKLPDNFQRADFLKDCGMVDMVIHRKDMKKTLENILKLLWNQKTD